MVGRLLTAALAPCLRRSCTRASASLAQSVERKALNLVVVGSSPTGGAFSAGETGLTLTQTLSGRNRTSDPVIADIYSHMLYQLSYAESLTSPRGAMEARRFPEPEVVGSIPTAGDLLSATGTWALSSVEERPFRIREVEGSNPSVSTLFVLAVKRSRQDSNLQPLDPRSNALPLSHATGQKSGEGGVRTHAPEETTT